MTKEAKTYEINIRSITRAAFHGEAQNGGHIENLEEWLKMPSRRLNIHPSPIDGQLISIVVTPSQVGDESFALLAMNLKAGKLVMQGSIEEGFETPSGEQTYTNGPRFVPANGWFDERTGAPNFTFTAAVSPVCPQGWTPVKVELLAPSAVNFGTTTEARNKFKSLRQQQRQAGGLF